MAPDSPPKDRPKRRPAYAKTLRKGGKGAADPLVSDDDAADLLDMHAANERRKRAALDAAATPIELGRTPNLATSDSAASDSAASDSAASDPAASSPSFEADATDRVVATPLADTTLPIDPPICASAEAPAPAASAAPSFAIDGRAPAVPYGERYATGSMPRSPEPGSMPRSPEPDPRSTPRSPEPDPLSAEPIANKTQSIDSTAVMAPDAAALTTQPNDTSAEAAISESTDVMPAVSTASSASTTAAPRKPKTLEAIEPAAIEPAAIEPAAIEPAAIDNELHPPMERRAPRVVVLVLVACALALMFLARSWFATDDTQPPRETAEQSPAPTPSSLASAPSTATSSLTASTSLPTPLPTLVPSAENTPPAPTPLPPNRPTPAPSTADPPDPPTPAPPTPSPPRPPPDPFDGLPLKYRAPTK